MQTHWMTPVHVDGYLYGSSGRHPHDAELRCIEWKTGKVMWSIPDLTRTSLLYVDGHFVCLGEYGQLTLFKANPQKYEPLGTANVPRELLRNPCWAAPIVSHGLLYVRGDDQLACLELIPDR
jgi:outer membrane protein assembly factor BamB